MATIKDICMYDGFAYKCAFCGYNEYPICLTAHHIFPKEYFRPQPNFAREDRYIILCPTCHTLVHRGIFVADGLQIIMNKINQCEIKYCKLRNIDNIIKLAKLIYAKAYKPEDL